MKRSHSLPFILVFLGIIYAVPLVQTAYEIRTNPGHRIQMLDLPADLFVTPSAKQKADAASIDSLAYAISMIKQRVADERAAARDSSSSWDPYLSIEQCEEALVRITVLKQSVLDYNRHVSGAKNSFAKNDTVKQYYRSLVKAEQEFEELRTLLESYPEGIDDLGSAVARLGATIAEAQNHIRSGNYGTRTLTALRRIMVGANYLRPYEKEMEKSSVFGTAIRPWMLYGYFKVFGDPGSKGVRGRYDWMFYRPDVEYLVRPDVFDERSRIVDANDAPLTEDIIGAIVDFKEQLAAGDVDLLFVIMPTKPSIYPDLLNASADPAQAGMPDNTRAIMKRLQAAGIDAVDLFSAFARERGNDAASGDSIYLRTDTHFRGRGVLAAARVIADRVKQYPWYVPGTTEYIVDTVEVPRVGDVGEMIGLPQQVTKKSVYPFIPETTACYQVYRIERDEKGAIEERALYRDDYRNSTILVLGDSFSRMYQTDQPGSAGWISHLARELSQPVASLVNDGGASTLVRETLARKSKLLRGKKLVIWEVVERDFRFGEEGWKKIEVVTR
ncbi:MAG: hypothetical protein JW768_12800 [Chitinispirillaceae bacterium]|nr:hypothetical protein [Chitinispirillaceae bacterium]